jgi:glycosyltransferase involved in cell wall biosynthesis
MKKSPKISVVTPSYNSAASIERAIQSVLEQDYANWEHVIADGLSTDGTVDILKRYSHLRWVSEKDKSQEEAMNKGFRRSTGDIIVYLNADDYFFPGAFSSVVKEFEKGAKFVMGNVLVKSPRLHSEFLNVPRTTLLGMIRHWEPNSFCHNPVAYFYAREVQERIPIGEETYAIQDLEFLLSAATLYPFVKINKTLGCFEDGTDTKTAKTQSRLDYWRPSTFDFIDKHLISLTPAERDVFRRDRSEGYARSQAHMNRLNRGSVRLLDPNQLPLVSVIIPSYNCQAYVCRAVDSVLGQGLEKVEIIIVDDASTDATLDVLQNQYGMNPYINIVRHEENAMLGAARNTGLDHARGTYVYFLDADDWLEPGALMRLVSIAEQYQAEVVECGSQKVWENGRKQVYHAHDFTTSGGMDALYHFAAYRIGSIAWNKLYLRSFIEGRRLRFPSPYWHEDVPFSARVAYYAKNYISVSDICHNYFQRDTSYVHKQPGIQNLKSNINLYLVMMQFIQEIALDATEDGRLLAYRVLEAHCSNEIIPKIEQYKASRPSHEWQSDIRSSLYEMLGTAGIGVADFVIASLNTRTRTIMPRRFRHLLRAYVAKHMPARWKTILKNIYYRLRSDA